METVRHLISLVESHQALTYGLIFVGLVFEGEVTLISAGIFAQLGAINVWFALLFIYTGGFLKTILGYYIGTLIGSRWSESKALKYIEKRVLNLMPNFEQKPFWSIFISKFIEGANHIVIIFSGYKKIDYKKYLRAEIISTLIWAPLLLSLGYFFGYTALNISKEIWRFSLIILILMILFFLVDKLIGWIYEIFEEFYDGN